MAEVARSNWADAEEELPSPEVIENKDGTKTIISYRLNDAGKKVKVTQKIKEIKITEKVHPDVARRKKWAKFGAEEGTAPGPDFRTTQVGEPVYLRLGTQWKVIEKEAEEKQKEESKKASVGQGIRCRLCGGSHFTSKCPFKDTLGADIENASGTPEPSAASPTPELTKTTGYIAPHLRNRNKDEFAEKDLSVEKEESSTLRFTQINENIDEQTFRDEVLQRFERVIRRVTLVKNRETGRSKGVAYVEFDTPEIAQKARDALDGRGYHSLILRVDFSKPRAPR
ncbi:hypothetical protein PACTADRAFT_55506 [Pachysolen tannophilus NRRL Y-2460]|uniref:Eukaryotic translation initiation factor 3 subunit G n=1 Tax=Pachysolen tannophilus NRRL Y-2460 TaxID=669874 RepID=A0A1E4TZK5_PACTA|nr:hypothetical protein PACTADRAFT_55506 [Pachysolen tannophilus NRRL Y-2460]